MTEETFKEIESKISDLRMHSWLIGGAAELAFYTISEILETLAREAIRHDS